MIKITAIVFGLVGCGLSIAAAMCCPKVLSDNTFLVGFINHEILNIMAVIMTITIATIATIHVWFNDIERDNGVKVFGSARREINQSAFFLIALFSFELALLIIRSLFDGAATEKNHAALAIFNGVSIVILVFSVLVLIDIMTIVKILTPKD